MEENLTPEQLLLAELTPEEQARLERLQQLESEASETPNQEVEVSVVAAAVFSPDGEVAPAPLPSQTIEGTPGKDTLIGGPGDDIISGLEDNDKISGKGGDDFISGGSGNDFIQGKEGDDLIGGDASPSGQLPLVGIGNDTLEGGKGDDKLSGQNGKDKLFGQMGNDFLLGGNDNDTIGGGRGNDRIFGQNGDDQIMAEQGDDTVEGGDGNDSIVGAKGNDNLFGDAANNRASGVDGNDTITGGNGNDRIFGGLEDDKLEGNRGKDTLTGGQGNDSLDGGEKADRLIGTETSFFGLRERGFGLGERDTLTGGINDDAFVLGLGTANGRDENANFVELEDVILYTNSNIDNNGTSDYALIKDFGFEGDTVVRGLDKIELAGSESMYSLGASPIDGISGTGIFLEEGQNTGELIGIVEAISQDSLNLGDSNQFVYV